MNKPKVVVTQNGLRAEGYFIRNHSYSPDWFLILVPGGEHWFHASAIEWNVSPA